MDAHSLPVIREDKITLAGERATFTCRVVERSPDRLTVLHVLDQGRDLHGVALPVGTLTLGTFWTNRPYNVYHFMDPCGETLAFYFNLAQDTRVTRDVLSWCDRMVDVLWVPGALPKVLDEDELPARLAPAVRADIRRDTDHLLRELPTLLVELTRADAAWYARLVGDGAGGVL